MLQRLASDFWFYLRYRKRYYVAAILLVFALLIVLSLIGERSAVAPRIYTLY